MLNKQNNTILHIILLITDLIASALSLLMAFLIRYGIPFGISTKYDQIWTLGLFLSITLIMNIVISPINKFTRRGPFVELLDVINRQFFTVVAVVVVVYLAHIGNVLSRLVILYYAIVSVLIVWLFRLLVKKYIVKVLNNNKEACNVLIYTTKDREIQLKNGTELYNDFGKCFKYTLTTDENDYQAVVEFITRNDIDEILISIPEVEDKKEYEDFISALVNMRIKVDVDINQFELDVPGHKELDQIGHYAVVAIAINTISISRQLVKRLFDILGGLVGSVIAFIALIILTPIIKLDSKGPVIFSQKRVGKNGRIFTFYKFRSMYCDAEEKKNELMAQNEVSGLMFKMEDDPRITKVGKFIRKTSIDELPQFWNVLLGDMSLIGTRPPTADEYNQYEPWQKARLSMKPGITGLWQISGRSDIKDFDEVVKLDVKYIDNWSFALDFKILLKTIGVVFTGKGSR